VNVRNIRVSDGWDSRKFVLYGTKDSKAFLLQIDFSDALTRKCGDNDYEEWYPSFYDEQCVLGRKIGYRRRKRDSICFNGEEHEAMRIDNNCPCVLIDYECDYCFEFDDRMQQCVFSCSDNPVEVNKLPPPPSNCNSYYEVSKGWRKVEDNKCEGGLGLPQGIVVCPGQTLPPRPLPTPPPTLAPTGVTPTSDNNIPSPTSNSSMRIVLVVASVIGVLALLVGGFFLLYKKNQRFHDFIVYTFNIGQSSPEVKYTKVVSDDLTDEEIEDDSTIN